MKPARANPDQLDMFGTSSGSSPSNEVAKPEALSGTSPGTAGKPKCPPSGQTDIQPRRPIAADTGHVLSEGARQALVELAKVRVATERALNPEPATSAPADEESERESDLKKLSDDGLADVCRALRTKILTTGSWHNPHRTPLLDAAVDLWDGKPGARERAIAAVMAAEVGL